jgi:hypothetical protein
MRMPGSDRVLLAGGLIGLGLLAWLGSGVSGTCGAYAYVRDQRC